MFRPNVGEWPQHGGHLLIAYFYPVPPIFVGDKVIDKLFLEYKKGVIKLFHLHVPFLPFERRDNQDAVVVQFDFCLRQGT
jgi:hypothetical protein